MKYLAFDIEAANGYMLSSICSIGVVIADEQFNILSRENIWINPRTRYNLNGTRSNVGIDLHLDRKLLNSSPDFRRVYSRIKRLLTDKQYTVVGHAVDSDVRMLNKACERYRLPSINFRFICSQLLYKLYKGDREIKGLSKIADEIGLTFQQHNSEEDAYASMMTLKYLVEQSGMSVEQLMDKYRIRCGANENFVMTRPVSLLGQVSKKSVTQLAIAHIREYVNAFVKEGNVGSNVSSAYKNKAFCLARSLEQSQSQELYDVLNAILRRGGHYSARVLKSNYYVKYGEPTLQDSMREQRVRELAEQGLIGIVTIEDILEDRL